MDMCIYVFVHTRLIGLRYFRVFFTGSLGCGFGVYKRIYELSRAVRLKYKGC